MAKSKKSIFLDEATKAKMYKLYVENSLTQTELAKHYNCSISVIKNFVNNYNSPVHQKRIAQKKSLHKEANNYYNEIWKELTYSTNTKYEVSNLGRLRSYARSKTHPLILNGILQMGYIFHDIYFIDLAKRKKKIMHEIVAEHFLPTPKPNQIYIIHKDYNKTNNKVNNLVWATKEQHIQHHKNNPTLIQAIEKRTNQNHKGNKLNIAQVERIRKMLIDPDRKLTIKQMAFTFKVSDMTIYRIRNGENWGKIGNSIEYTKKRMNSLDLKTVKIIRTKLKSKDAVGAAIAKEFGITVATVSRIKNNKSYKNLK